jgi:hypothetical protein
MATTPFVMHLEILEIPRKFLEIVSGNRVTSCSRNSKSKLAFTRIPSPSTLVTLVNVTLLMLLLTGTFDYAVVQHTNEEDIKSKTPVTVYLAIY